MDANIALDEDAAGRYGFEKAVSSWEAVAEDPSIGTVSIVVGDVLHRPFAEALVAVGKHALCENPLACPGPGRKVWTIAQLQTFLRRAV